MDIRKLQIFEAVARLQNFSRAAEELHMAQPAVSIAVQKLENELELRLLDRESRKVRLTAEGEEALQRARQILFQVDELTHHMRDLSELASGELTIACPSMLATYHLPILLGGFLSCYPGVSAQVTQAGTQLIEQKLLNDEIELGIITLDGLKPDLEITPLISEEVVLCMTANHPWAKRKTINIKELDQQNMVLYEQDYFIRQTLDQLCRSVRVKPEIRLQTNFLPLIARMVKDGLGLSVALQMMVAQEPEISGVALRPAIKIEMGIAKRVGRQLSRANQGFLDWITIERKKDK